MKKVIVILGQTATGKSALAVKIAKKLNGEVISADSRQIYKYLDIGTGKITRKEMQGVPHHLLDIANPKKQFSVAEYKELAEEKIKEIIARGKIPIICGGTGFYIDAVTKGIVLPAVPPNKKLRNRLRNRLSNELYNMLFKLDKARAKNVDPHNKVRLVRAIEIARALGKVPKIKKAKPIYEFIKIGLYLPPDKLKSSIEKRVKKMFKNGLLKEVNKLKKPARLGGMGISGNRLKELGFEYNNPEIDRVIVKTTQYAKRQMTWFKRDPEITWIDGAEIVLEKMVKKILKQL